MTWPRLASVLYDGRLVYFVSKLINSPALADFSMFSQVISLMVLDWYSKRLGNRGMVEGSIGTLIINLGPIFYFLWAVLSLI